MLPGQHFLMADAPVDPNIIRRHSGLIGTFGLHLVKNGQLPEWMAKFLGRAHELQLMADYQAISVDTVTAEEIVEQAKAFVATIKAHRFAIAPEHARIRNPAPLSPLDSVTGLTPGRIDNDTEFAIRRFLELVASRYEVEAAILYGSRARGTHRPDSDADVAVLMRGDQDYRAVTQYMAGAAFDVLLETDILVSALPIWLSEWENPDDYSNPVLLHNISREGTRL